MSERKRIVIQEDLAAEALAYLEALDLDVVAGGDWDERELLERIGGVHGLIVGPAAGVTAEVIRAGAKLEVVGRTGVSVDNVDLSEATRRGIIVVNAPQSNAVSMAEQGCALVLACACDLAQANADLRAGRWEAEKWSRSGVEVSGKTLGIVGPGPVGPLLAERAGALGMTVLAGDPESAEAFLESPPAAAGDPRRVYADADFIVVLPPDAAPDEPLVGRDEFAQMKDGVRLVSLAGRGAVDGAAWRAAIDNGKVAASAVTAYKGDVVAGDPLADCDTVLFAPHLEASTVDARLRAQMMVAEQVATVLSGRFATNAVNVPAVLGEDAAELMPYLGLCAQLGRLVVQLASGPVHSVQITYGGSFAYYDTQILTLGVLEGVLSGSVDGRVNYVNAQMVADERGVTATESRQSDIPDFPRVITVAASDPRGDVSVSGASLGPESKARIVRVFGEDVDIEPAAHMLFLRYLDRPGIGGAVGTLLGEWGINIGHMSVGRGRAQHEAVMALTLDEPLTAGQLDQLVTHCDVQTGKAVEL